MFAKLLKHDFRAVFKYWWIGALVSLGISVLGGFAGRIGLVSETKYGAIADLAFVVFIFSIGLIFMLPMFTQIILLIRYQRHFFSDEGYLTFTLPVKKTTLVDSKLTVSFVFSVVSYIIIFFEFWIIFALSDIGIDEGLSMDYTVWYEEMNGYAVPYIILFVLIGMVLILCSNALIYACVTIASAIVRKFKIFAGLGIYAGVTSLVSSIVRVVVVSLSFSIYDPSAQELSALFNHDTGLALFIGILGILIAVFGALYFVITVILDKKLNLA